MCGIAGFVSKQGDADQKLINNMLDVIMHRGPDDEGTYLQDNLALGHRRLSILDLSPDGKQPMSYKSRYYITFNGEIYNYIELKEELQKQGYTFTTKTDTEVILAAFDYWGNQCVSHFNGMWSFCIFDNVRRILYCSRDRFGVKPFYYMEDSKHFAFGSEIKQLLPVMEEEPKVNHDMMAAFLVCGALDYSQETMFQNIYQLPGGYSMIYSLKDHSRSIEKWYELYEVKEKKRSFQENVDLFREKFENSIHLRLRSDVPVGFCLSGGLDSSAIVCTTNHLMNKEGITTEQHTISSCFEDKRYDEQEYMDAVIDKTGANSHKIFPDMNQVFAELDKIIWHMDEPFGSTSIYAQWNVYREAKKQGLTVMLDGQGADEQLAGYTAFYDLLFSNLLRRGRLIRFLHEVRCYDKMRSATEVGKTIFRIKVAVANTLIPKKLKQIIRKKQKAYTPASLFPQELLDNPFVIKIKNSYGLVSPRKYIHTSIHFGMSELLHYEDRNSMAYSIEARLPFLDYQLVEAVYSMPLEHKIKDGITKRVMREALRDIMPRKISERYSKLGFVTPEDQWIKDNREAIREEVMRSCKILGPFVDEQRVMGWFDQNIDKLRRGDFAVWRIICAARWMELFKVKVS